MRNFTMLLVALGAIGSQISCTEVYEECIAAGGSPAECLALANQQNQRRPEADAGAEDPPRRFFWVDRACHNRAKLDPMIGNQTWQRRNAADGTNVVWSGGPGAITGRHEFDGYCRYSCAINEGMEAATHRANIPRLPVMGVPAKPTVDHNHGVLTAAWEDNGAFITLHLLCLAAHTSNTDVQAAFGNVMQALFRAHTPNGVLNQAKRILATQPQAFGIEDAEEIIP